MVENPVTNGKLTVVVNSSNRRDFNSSIGAAATAETPATAWLDIKSRKNYSTATAGPKVTQERFEASEDTNQNKVAKTGGNGE